MTFDRVTRVLAAFGLASALFLPVAAGREMGDELLMWTARHSAELVCAWAAIALLSLWALRRLAQTDDVRSRLMGLALLGVLPGLSVVAVTGRAIRDAIGGFPAWVPLTGTAVVLAVLIAGAFARPRLLASGLLRVFACGCTLVFPLVSFGLKTEAVRAGAPAPAVQAGEGCRDLFVLLFDELSYTSAFDSGRAVWPHLARLAAEGDVYHRASSPAAARRGSDANTLDALSAYLGSTPHGEVRAEDASIFGVARRTGLHADVSGWYFPYCKALDGFAERCRDHSFYNASPVEGPFNPVAPLLSAINIWPFQLPTGLLKRPVATWLHRRTLQRLVREASEPPVAHPAFRWVHFNVPHFPWLYDTGPLRLGAFTPTPNRYARQVEEADRALGTVLQSLDARQEYGQATIVVVADHASRNGLADDQRHVPLVVRRPGASRRDHWEPVDVADILTSLPAMACGR